MEATSPPAAVAPASQQAVLDALARGATVLTPTAAAAQQLARTADAAALARGTLSWRSPAILPWNAWAHAQWSAATVRGETSRVLLSSTQERALWTRIIDASAPETLVAAASHADICMRAGRLLASAGAEAAFRAGRHPEAQTVDMETFRHWYLRFQDVCRREDYLSAGALDTSLALLLAQQQTPCNEEYILYGFADLLPARRAVVAALQQAGAAVTELQPVSPATAPPTMLQYPDRTAQLRACAAWARARLQVAPGSTVTIVVPDLAEVRSEVERELRLAVAPGSANVLRPAPLPYRFTSGLPLPTLPLVRHALLMLQWCHGGLALDDVGMLLRSPHLALAASPENGAVLDESVLRKTAALRKHMSLSRAVALLHAHAAGRRLGEVQRAAAPLRNAAQQTFAWFADRVPGLLHTAGWPGTAPLDDDEQGAAEQWQRALDAAASLDLLGATTDWEGFLAQLTTVVGRAEFTSKQRPYPLQVMTASEAEGTSAEALWFLHADADTWPPRLTPSALLPRSLQREFAMPGLQPEQDETLAAVHLRQLLGSVSGEVRISWSADAEGGAGEPSPVAQRVTLALGGELRAAPEEIHPEPAPALLETFFDITPLPRLGGGDTPGGVGVLTAQAQCGFRAWAEKRVFAGEQEQLEDGLSPGERGEQVHAVLQRFWHATGTHAELCRLSRAMLADGRSERDTRLQLCIAEVCRPASARGWDAAYLAVQQQRLFRLLAAWLDYEETRPPFRVLKLEEEVKHVPVGPLQLSMRVDRVDTILARDEAAGSLGTVLIDYKTGRSSHSDWEGERPNQPQLPAYAVAAAVAAGVDEVGGIAFASIRAGAGKMQLDSAAGPNLLPPRGRKDPVTFAEHLQEWQGSVDDLARAFAEGNAAADPKLYPQTCCTCSQRILCRLNVAELLQNDDDQLEEYPVEAE